MGGGHGETSTAATEPLWWPPGKIAGRHLAPFLAAWTGLAVPPAPPLGSGAVEVEIDLAARESPQQGP